MVVDPTTPNACNNVAARSLQPSYACCNKDVSVRVVSLTDGQDIYSYQSDSNQLSTRSGDGVVLDAAGNMTDNGRGLSFEYNQIGRLKRVYDQGELVATYTYNAFGQRTRKVTPAGTTLYHYDVNGQLIDETTEDGQPITTYLWQDRTPVAVIFAPDSAPNANSSERLVYLHSDHLGTPRSATDAHQQTVWRWRADAFGATAANEDPDGDGVLTTVPLRFPGQYYDAESRLHYNWHRYYDPSTGRYVQSDPIGLGGGLNTYGYVGGNPMTYADPNGLVRWEGTGESYGIVAPVGAIVQIYELYSECVNGKRASAKVLFIGGAVGVGATLGASKGPVAFVDYNDTPQPWVFEGMSATASAGFVTPFGSVGVGATTLNKAFSKPSGTDSDTFGLDYGVAFSPIGGGTLIDYRYEDCACE